MIATDWILNFRYRVYDQWRQWWNKRSLYYHIAWYSKTDSTPHELNIGRHYHSYEEDLDLLNQRKKKKLCGEKKQNDFNRYRVQFIRILKKKYLIRLRNNYLINN